MNVTIQCATPSENSSSIPRRWKSPWALAALLLLTSCQGPKLSDRTTSSAQCLTGVYRLVSLQPQDETTFKPLENIVILKFFTDHQWVSPTYQKDTHKVVYVQGGSYTFDGVQYTETITYHSKDLSSVGLSTTFKLTLKKDGLYQSGVFKAGTTDAYKVEENWERID